MSSPEGLRVVVTGHTGLSKDRALCRLCKFICHLDPEWESAGPRGKEEAARRVANLYSAEAGLPPMATFLGGDWRYQRDTWLESIQGAIDRYKSDKPKIAFLSLHASFHWYNILFSPISWERRATPQKPGSSALIQLLWQFKPHYFVTLIDDVQMVQKRIREQHKGFTISLRELFRWRDTEIMLTDLLALETVPRSYRARDSRHAPFERSPVVAIRHSPKMLARFLLEPWRPRVYASFPISRIRREARADWRAEVDRFRKVLGDDLTLFDPLTIDEMPLEGGYRARFGPEPDPAELRRNRIRIEATDRWRIEAGETLIGEDPVGVDIVAEEIHDITSRVRKGVLPDLHRQTQWRDFRLIEQSDFVVTYRPQLGGSEGFSGGTEKEMDYAQRIAHKPWLVIHDEDEDGEIEPEVFDQEAGPFLYEMKTHRRHC